MSRVSFESFLTLLLLLLVGALLLGNALGQPILFGFVETGSMSPTLEAGDGFVAVPSFLTGEPSVGDVIVFEAEDVQGGGLTTHRIVGQTDGGYATKGDANPFTDQDGGEPPVTEDRIVADVLQVGGSVVTLPGFGTGVERVRDGVVALLVTLGISTTGDSTAGLVLLVAGFALILVSFFDERRGSSRDRVRSVSKDLDARLVLVIMLAAVLIPANAAMLGPAQTHEIGGVEEAEEPEAGDLTAEITARNDGLIAMVVVLESVDGEATLSDTSVELPAGEESVVTVTPRRGTEGPYAVSEHRYFLLLPSSLIVALHSASPWLALGLINVLLGVGVVGLVVGLVGTGRVRVRDTKGGVPFTTRLRRRLR